VFDGCAADQPFRKLECVAVKVCSETQHPHCLSDDFWSYSIARQYCDF
jgi:hypothetical protein